MLARRALATSTRAARTYATQASSSVQPPLTLYSLSGKYATAAFSAALKQSPKTLTQVATELRALRDSVSKDAQLRELVHNPTLTRAERQAAIDKLVGALNAKSDITKNLLAVLGENGRLADAEKIADDFEKLVAAYNGEVEVVVTTAQPLDAKLHQRLETALKSSSVAADGKKLKISNKVNPAVLGGLVVEFGEKTVDLSVASKVNRLNNLINESV